MRGVLPVAVPHPEMARPNSALTVEKEVGGKEADPTTEEAPGDAAPADEVSDKKDTPALAFFPSWDEMVEMLKRVPCITNSESPFTKMSDFFSFTKRISVNLGGNSLPSSQPGSPLALLSLLCFAFSSCRIGRCRRLSKW